MEQTTEKRSPFARVGRWLAELILVFIGVYAAFWLNNYQQHQQNLQRHDQILASLERQLNEGIASVRDAGARADREVAEFKRALATGEMPPLQMYSFSSDYSATDIATLLQSGGIELLDLKTLAALRNLESVIRNGLAQIAHFQKLSDELIVPNLDQDTSFFYDPATKKLRKRFERYPDALGMTANFLHELERAQTDLLKQIQAERRRH
jgi:uncharacterized protein YukE